VEIVEDESVRAAVEAAIAAADCSVYGDPSTGLMANGMINAKSPPTSLAYDVYWRTLDGSKEWKVGSVSFTAGSGSVNHGYGGALPKDFNESRIDIVLHPSTRAGSETIEIVKILGGDVTLRNVPVTLPGPVEKSKSDGATR
jgi:hypothetical protein